MIPQAALVAKERIEACIADFRSWMYDNKLKLSQDKTKLIVITPYQQSKKVDIDIVQVGDCDIKPTHSARNLRATFDHAASCLTNNQILQLNMTEQKISDKKAASERLISFRLDNGNSLSYGLL